MKRLTLAFLIVPFMLLPLCAQDWLSGEGWTFSSENGGVKIYTRLNPENGRYEAKALYSFEQEGEKYLNRLRIRWTDIRFEDHIPADYPKGYRLLRGDSVSRTVVMTPDGPFFLKDREIIVKQNFSPLTYGQGWVCYARALPDELPRTPGMIRVEVFDAVWIARVEEGKMHLALRFTIDPGGTAPEIITRKFVEGGATGYLLRLVDILTHDAWFAGLE